MREIKCYDCKQVFQYDPENTPRTGIIKLGEPEKKTYSYRATCPHCGHVNRFAIQEGK